MIRLGYESRFWITCEKYKRFIQKQQFFYCNQSLTEQVSKESIINIVKEIDTILESIEVISTEIKLFSKASDIILSRCLIELGLKSKAVSERGNSAGIIPESVYGYTLVTDAKTFRMSRTVKNQKDFKISTLINWRGMEHGFALLVSPYF